MPTDNERALNIDLIKRSFAYNHHNGQIKRTFSYGRAIAGQTFDDANTVSVYGTSIRIARLAWLLFHGDWPPTGYHVDHINGIKADNRILNLRRKINKIRLVQVDMLKVLLGGIESQSLGRPRSELMVNASILDRLLHKRKLLRHIVRLV